MAVPGGQAAIKGCLIDTLKSDGSSAYYAGTLVKLSANETATPTTAQGENCIGVVNQDVSATEAAAGMPVEVIYSGKCWLIADQAITRMALLCAGTTTKYRVDPATTADYCFGKALTAATAAADKFQAIVDFSGASSIY